MAKNEQPSLLDLGHDNLCQVIEQLQPVQLKQLKRFEQVNKEFFSLIQYKSPVHLSDFDDFRNSIFNEISKLKQGIIAYISRS
jgi:chromosome segregation and condensation protein ScpB